VSTEQSLVAHAAAKIFEIMFEKMTDDEVQMVKAIAFKVCSVS